MSDVAVSPQLGAVLALYTQFPDHTSIGGDIIRLDLASGDMTPLVQRADPTESLGAPTWFGSQIAFERSDLSTPAVGYAYQAAVRYPTRIEVVQPDGGGRAVLIDDARQPSPSPDATQLVYVRSAPNGGAILVGDGTTERELLAAGGFPDVASPKFSPDGRRIAFVVATPIAYQPSLLEQLLDLRVAYAHGLPFDVWIMDVDGSNPHLLAATQADDPSIAWSPDGSQLFVYGGTGSYIVDVATGDLARYPYITGYGGTSWVPQTS